jgi:hypothetical protein
VIDSCINFQFSQTEVEQLYRGFCVLAGTASLPSGNSYSQGINIDNFRAVTCTFGLWSSNCPIFMSNFMIDDGATLLTGMCPIYIANAIGPQGESCLSCGQVLNHGGTYGIELYNCSAVMIQNVGFTHATTGVTAHIWLTGTGSTWTTLCSIQGCNFGAYTAVLADLGTTNSKAYNNSYGASFTDNGTNFLVS